MTLFLFISSSRACLASRDPYCIWLRTGTCANMAPGFKYVTVPYCLSLTLSLCLSVSPFPSYLLSLVWRPIRLLRSCPSVSRVSWRVVHLKVVNLWWQSERMDVEVHCAEKDFWEWCWYKSLLVKTLSQTNSKYKTSSFMFSNLSCIHWQILNYLLFFFSFSWLIN